MGSLLQAFITGLQGAIAGQVREGTQRDRQLAEIVSTAIGRRLQLFSPSPATKGSASSTSKAITGPISSAGVSIDGGSSDSTA